MNFSGALAATKTQTSSASTNVSTPASAPPVSAARKAERIYFAEAQKALDKKQFNRYELILPKIKNYPLLPYLEYQELGERLMSRPRKDVDDFFARYPDSYLAERLRHRWLRTLALQELWSDYLRYYDHTLTDPELACLNLRARLETGDKAALKEVLSLWNIPKPQSKSCDPVVAEWKRAGYLTPALLWSRHAKAVKADEISLATSLLQEMEPAQQALALQYQNVAQNPRILLQPHDAPGALELWKTYQNRGGFTGDESVQIVYTIARQLLRQELDEEAEKLVAATPNLTHPDLMELLIREALRQQDWEKSYNWILRLPKDSQKTERWSYWQARLMEELDIKEVEGKKPRDIYANLATTRGYYGFLSADKLGLPYSLSDKPLALSKEFMFKVEFMPGIQRAREFYLLGDIPAASREWNHTTRKLSTTPEMVAAGRLADRWSWYRQAIQTMGDAEYWDDLQVRFPLVHHENVRAAAKKAALDPHFVFAITRQESAFNSEAKSPVGALGLMQLMPETAKSTAKKAGINFKQQDLLEVDKNIVLGSRYLNELLVSFSGNRILAAAAYNAGPGRVRKWLTKEGEKLPYDVWIETIPYKETRSYVQNILAFTIIYGYRTGSKQPFITAEEASRYL
ncbi:MAG: lytic murein transglycosylase [Moraxellaceae bacterium]|nr:MAG: lytic murein transglycosylase [Moraxellaceae bacterium]